MKIDMSIWALFAYISLFWQLINRWSQCVQDQLSPVFD